MLRYGQVIPESVRRGYIKGTNIENESRTLPNKTNFGTYNASGFVSTKIIGVVSRPAIFTLCAIFVGKDSNFKSTEIGFIW
jgi:hypothetical protein